MNKNGKNALLLHSDNSYYPPYEVKVSDILEIWEFACSIALHEFESNDALPENVNQVLKGLSQDVRALKAAILK